MNLWTSLKKLPPKWMNIWSTIDLKEPCYKPWHLLSKDSARKQDGQFTKRNLNSSFSQFWDSFSPSLLPKFGIVPYPYLASISKPMFLNLGNLKMYGFMLAGKLWKLKLKVEHLQVSKVDKHQCNPLIESHIKKERKRKKSFTSEQFSLLNTINEWNTISFISEQWTILLSQSHLNSCSGT